MHFLTAYYLILYLISHFLLKNANSEENWQQSYDIGILANAIPSEFYKLIANETFVDLVTDGVVPKSVDFKVHQSWACDELSAVNSILQLWKSYKVSVIFGPECSEGMIAMGLVATAVNKLVIGFRSISGVLSNNTQYSTLIRMSNSMGFMASAIGTVLDFYNWSEVSIVQNTTNCNSQLSRIPFELKKRGITIVNNIPVDFSNPGSIDNALFILKLTSRIILVCNGYNPLSVVDFLIAAEKAGMNTPDYVYITPYYRVESYSQWQPWLQSNYTREYAATARKAYQNAILIQTTNQTGKTFANFKSRLTQIVDMNEKKEYSTKFFQDYMITAAILRDSIYLYGAILNKSIENNIDVSTGTSFVASTFNVVIQTGATGKIVIDDSGDKLPKYDVLKMSSDGYFSLYMIIDDLNDSDQNYVLNISNSSVAIPQWNTRNNLPPPMKPICGFQNELCKTDYTLVLSVSLPVSLMLLLLLILAALLFYRKYNFEKQLLAMNWRIDLSQFHFSKLPIQEVHYTVSSGSLPNAIDPDVERVTNYSASTNSSSNRYAGTAIYKGNTVQVKKWQRQMKFQLTRDFLLRLKMMKDMNHDNVNKFVGFTLDVENAALCIWEYCSKRSLQDLIFNEDIHLDVTFQSSILRDIVSGIEYIHLSPISHHGRLYISNCVVDSRWTVKLTDFGMQPLIDFMKLERIIIVEEQTHMDKMLCTAPELLRYSGLKDLKPADIYQFGMVMYELLFREPPFVNSHLTSEEIVITLKRETSNSVTLRPTLKHLDGFGSGIEALMISCWRENVANRPSIGDLKKELFNNTKKMGKNLMDHAMSMLEQYATNLEKIVDERTGQLNEERTRADKLLYQLLPKAIADSLKSGHTVQPETFECATIYFSDIVGFTVLCSKSRPVEIVQMLNTLYSQFDALIMKCDAFKVETIGDAYLVVSGLPVRNGNKHATTMADLALEILKTIGKYKIPHLPEAIMKLRIGIHSGPVAAGVVGLTMPKYCLFGDSVNFASRMESSGEAGKIQITEFTKRMLDKFPEYIIDLRGEIDVKGKGLCTTYWLVDKVK